MEGVHRAPALLPSFVPQPAAALATAEVAAARLPATLARLKERQAGKEDLLGDDGESAMLDSDTGTIACQLTAAQLSKILQRRYAEQAMAPPAGLAGPFLFGNCDGVD